MAALRRNDRPLYGERQRGGLCQMHALNAYFGRRALDPAAFTALCRKYDSDRGLPPGTSGAGAAGFCGVLVGAHVRGSAAHETILHHAITALGDPFDEVLSVSAAYEAPGSRRLDSAGRPIAGAWTRPRLNPARLAAQGLRAVFVATPTHIWIWRFGSVDGGDPRWYRIDSQKNGGRPSPGDPAREWNGRYMIAVAIPRDYRPV